MRLQKLICANISARSLRDLAASETAHEQFTQQFQNVQQGLSKALETRLQILDEGLNLDLWNCDQKLNSTTEYLEKQFQLEFDERQTKSAMMVIDQSLRALRKIKSDPDSTEYETTDIEDRQSTRKPALRVKKSLAPAVLISTENLLGHQSGLRDSTVDPAAGRLFPHDNEPPRPSPSVVPSLRRPDIYQTKYTPSRYLDADFDSRSRYLIELEKISEAEYARRIERSVEPVETQQKPNLWAGARPPSKSHELPLPPPPTQMQNLLNAIDFAVADEQTRTEDGHKASWVSPDAGLDALLEAGTIATSQIGAFTASNAVPSRTSLAQFPLSAERGNSEPVFPAINRKRSRDSLSEEAVLQKV